MTKKKTPSKSKVLRSLARTKPSTDLSLDTRILELMHILCPEAPGRWEGQSAAERIAQLKDCAVRIANFRKTRVRATNEWCGYSPLDVRVARTVAGRCRCGERELESTDGVQVTFSTAKMFGVEVHVDEQHSNQPEGCFKVISERSAPYYPCACGEHGLPVSPQLYRFHDEVETSYHSYAQCYIQNPLGYKKWHVERDVL